jgi:hypothetical protein
MYIKFTSHEPSDFENDAWKVCRFDRLGVVGFQTLSPYMVPESCWTFSFLSTFLSSLNLIKSLSIILYCSCIFSEISCPLTGIYFKVQISASFVAPGRISDL